jgi:hypothetical protein
MKLRTGVLGASVLAAAAILAGSSPQSPPDTTTSADGRRANPAHDTTLWVAMHEVNLHIDDQHVMRVRELHGQVTATTPGTVPLLDDPTSFRIRVTNGTVDLSGPDLAALLNQYVFAYKGAPIRDLHARIEGSSVIFNGIMHKGVDLPFEMTSELSLEPDGRIRSHPTKMKMLGVNGAKLLHALGLHLDKILDLSGSRGASVSGDDLLLDPLKMIPPPAIVGRLASVRVEGDHVSQTFARSADDSIFVSQVHADSSVHNYLYFRGGQLRFGKLLMTDTDLLIGDADESDPLDLYMAKYNTQLVAGSTRNLPNLGLRVSMPDYNDVGSSKAVAVSRKDP